MNADPDQDGILRSRADLAGGLQQVRALIESGDYNAAIIDCRLLLRDPAVNDHPDLFSEVLGNLGTLLLFEVKSLGDGATAARPLDEAIERLNHARRVRRSGGVRAPATIFDTNLVLAHYQRFCITHRAGDLLVANLILDGIESSDDPALQDWIASVRDCLNQHGRRAAG